MRRRTRYSLLAVGILFALLGVALLLHLNAPPQVARLLPESDAILYVNLRPIRTATNFDKHPVQHAPDFQQFINATGILPERDLDSVALALHRMANPNGPNGAVAYSEVMEGHFNATRLNAWFAAHSTAQETYARHTIYTIPVEGRAFRVTTLGYEMVAGSNMPTAEQIHSIIDRYEASASPFSGSSLLSARYREVPIFSRRLAWGIGHIGLPFSENGKISVLGVQLPLAEDTDLVASIALRGTLRLHGDGVALRIEEIAPSEQVAADSSQSLTAIVNLVKGLAPYAARTQDDTITRDFLQSLKVEQHKDRVIMTGTLSPEFVQRLSDASK